MSNRNAKLEVWSKERSAGFEIDGRAWIGREIQSTSSSGGGDGGVKQRSNEPVVKFFTSVADEPFHDTWRKGCRIIDREKCFTYFPVVYRRTMSPATRARGQKRRTNGPHYFARVGTTHGRACEPKLSLSPPLSLHIFYTLYERPSFSICFFAAKSWIFPREATLKVQ